jgi:oxygen-independent coproporphyrinogen-3 oxidase
MIEALYVHVPFCDDICSYCDFVRVRTNAKLIESYLLALQAETARIQQHAINTIYIGGGTPSALNLEELETLFQILEPYSHGLKEYTIEMNPESVSAEKAALCRRYGINRVSFGVQSFDANELAMMNRHHDVAMIESGLAALRAEGITNISIDLIYGLPHQTLDIWKNNLRQALALKTEHISLYALTIEPNSQFGRDKVQAAPSELEEDMYFEALDTLRSAGFERYEISNFTRQRRSHHNLHYWHMDEYLGLGPGAVSFVGGQRIENTAKLTYYFDGRFHANVQDLTHEDQMFEAIMMGLRTLEGIELKKFETRFQTRLLERYAVAIERAQAKGWLEVTPTHVRCNDVGLGLLHDVVLLFMD